MLPSTIWAAVRFAAYDVPGERAGGLRRHHELTAVELRIIYHEVCEWLDGCW
jgi:hypothetical protein